MGEAIEVTILNALHSSGLYWLFRYSSWSTSILATWIKSKRGGEEGREREEKHCVEVYLEQSKYCPRCFELLVKFSRACLNTGTPVAPAFLGKKRERRRFYPLQRISMIAFKHQLSNDSTTKRSRLTENLTRVASISMKFHHASEIITHIYISISPITLGNVTIASETNSSSIIQCIKKTSLAFLESKRSSSWRCSS